ncbi:hypothetical protein Q7C36_017792 [Tachysurus vachellii]|uniref:exo-alpha-sialidase n=1 Tax=Tachysurus vachellii TaxID=175792 RepID=A0AA88M3Q6_TACVA|nr:hypothetical protein Q7C36_017792 [Tachysurus vachellii]
MENSTGRHRETPGLSPTTVFTNKDSDFYRIPALIYIDQTFLAFAEKRTSIKDEHAKVLVLNRGKRQNGSVQWSGVEELKEAKMLDHRTMNPCPVYDEKNKRLFLFFICVRGSITEQEQIKSGNNAARLCYITSSDSGETWSELTDLTESVIGDEIHNWATFGVGPGHGLQMKDGGRLIVPAYAYTCCVNLYCCATLCCPAKPYSFAFYSDDKGTTWKFGNKLSVESIECQMAEVNSEDGNELYCSARSTEGHRVEAFSEDKGESFQKIRSNGRSNAKLVEPPNGCQGSVVSFQHGTETWLMFSHTTDKKERKNLGIYLNKTPKNPAGWAEPYIINHGTSGYSDVVQCDQENFACLLERTTDNSKEIVFVEFKLSDMPNL